MTDRDDAIERLDPALLDHLWDFGDPAGTESRFHEHLAQLEPGSIAAAELTTQIARAMGLQGRFDEADSLLDGIEAGLHVEHLLDILVTDEQSHERLSTELKNFGFGTYSRKGAKTLSDKPEACHSE